MFLYTRHVALRGWDQPVFANLPRPTFNELPLFANIKSASASFEHVTRRTWKNRLDARSTGKRKGEEWRRCQRKHYRIPSAGKIINRRDWMLVLENQEQSSRYSVWKQQTNVQGLQSRATRQPSWLDYRRLKRIDLHRLFPQSLCQYVVRDDLTWASQSLWKAFPVPADMAEFFFSSSNVTALPQISVSGETEGKLFSLRNRKATFWQLSA